MQNTDGARELYRLIPTRGATLESAKERAVEWYRGHEGLETRVMSVIIGWNETLRQDVYHVLLRPSDTAKDQPLPQVESTQETLR